MRPSILFLSLLGGACSRASRDAPGAAVPDAGVAPDLVVVLVDGLRAGAGELDGARSAFVAAAGTTGVRFTSAYTQSIQPDLALGALLTGRYPSQIPLCSHPPVAAAEAADLWCLGVPDSVQTLAQVLGYYGYHSALISRFPIANPGVDRGFDVVSADGLSDWAALRGAARTWWAGASDAPRLLVVHGSLDLVSVRATLEATDEGALAAAWDRERLTPLPVDDAARYHPPLGDGRTLADVGSAVHDGYVAAAADAGREIAALLEALGGTRPRRVVLTSLYGVSLDEFGGTLHAEQLVPGQAKLLLERTTHVPLELLGSDPGEVTVPAQLVDVAPTLLALAGARVPAGVSGRDLLAPAPAEPIAYAEFGDMLSLRIGDDRLSFRSEHHGTSSLSPALTAALVGQEHADRPATYQLFDVVRDPLEHTDLAGSRPDVLAGARARLLTIRQGVASPPEGLSEEDVRQLNAIRARGYW